MPMNIQPAETIQHSNGETLDVHSMFMTIQGEGPFAGRPALFIRLAGCNLTCPLCDTEYTSGRQKIHVADIVSAAQDELSVVYRKLIVITGGEPFRQNLEPLMRELKDRLPEARIQVETNGKFPPRLGTAIVDIVVSPKTHRVHDLYATFAPYIRWKYVVDSNVPLDVEGFPTSALGHPLPHGKTLPHPPPGTTVYFQPLDAKNNAENARNLQAALACVQQYTWTPHVRVIGQQLHKNLGLE